MSVYCDITAALLCVILFTTGGLFTQPDFWLRIQFPFICTILSKMDRNLMMANKELQHLSTADYWPDMLETSEENAAENNRRASWYDERCQHLRSEKGRRQDWEHSHRKEESEEGLRRDKFLAFLLLDDYREHTFRTGWQEAVGGVHVSRTTPPASPSTSVPAIVIQPTMTAYSPSESAVKPIILQAYSDMTSDRRPPRVDTEAAREHSRRVNEALGYDTPRTVVNNDCHLCSATCADQRLLRRHLRNKHPEECTDLFHCGPCKLTFLRRDSAINHHRRIHNVEKITTMRPLQHLI